MENFTNQLNLIVNHWEEMTIKKAKEVRKQLNALKKNVVNERRWQRKAINETIVPEIKKVKEWLKLNTKRRPRTPKVIEAKPQVVQEVEAPAIDPIPQEELNTSNPV